MKQPATDKQINRDDLWWAKHAYKTYWECVRLGQTRHLGHYIDLLKFHYAKLNLNQIIEFEEYTK